MATDPRQIIEPVLVDGIESAPGVRMRLRWPDLADQIASALRAAGLLAPAAPAGTGSPSPAPEVHNDNCGSCCCCSVDTDRLRAELSQVQREQDAARENRDAIAATLDRLYGEVERIADSIPAGIATLPALLTQLRAALTATAPETAVNANDSGEHADTATSGERGSDKATQGESGLPIGEVGKNSRDVRCPTCDGFVARPAEVPAAPYVRALGELRIALLRHGVDTTVDTDRVAAVAIETLDEVAGDRDEARSALAALRAEVGAAVKRCTTVLDAGGPLVPELLLTELLADIGAALVTDQSPATPGGEPA